MTGETYWEPLFSVIKTLCFWKSRQTLYEQSKSRWRTTVWNLNWGVLGGVSGCRLASWQVWCRAHVLRVWGRGCIETALCHTGDSATDSVDSLCVGVHFICGCWAFRKLLPFFFLTKHFVTPTLNNDSVGLWYTISKTVVLAERD